jgi:acyl dehydratase
MPFLEDFRVGDRAAFGRYEVTREEVVRFAGAYDPQPFHLDDAAAAQTHFGRLSASGWHSCAMTMAMVVAEQARRDAAGDDPGGSLGAVGIDRLRWLRPVHPGDVLRVETEILEVTPSRSRPDMGSVRSRLTVLNQNDEAVMTQEPIVLFRRRGGSA